MSKIKRENKLRKFEFIYFFFNFQNLSFVQKYSRSFQDGKGFTVKACYSYFFLHWPSGQNRQKKQSKGG